METLFLLIPLSLVFIGLIGAILWWAIQSGQYDDLDKPAHEILLDDDDAGASSDESESGNSDQS